MAYQISSFRRFPAAFAIVAASALAFTGLIATASPAYAQSGSDYRCAGLAEQALAAFDAAKQFRAALKIAGVTEVETDSQMASR